MIDWANSTFEVWEDELGMKYFGCRHTETGKEHGIVRSYRAGDAITEASYKNGVRHGFCRYTCADEVMIQLFNNDTEVAYFKFDPSFRESIRFGVQKQLLEDLGPEDFALGKIDYK